MVSELFTNVIRHCQGSHVRITARATVDELVIAVGDDSPTAPLRRPPMPEDERGHGWALVGLLADAWGTEATDLGTRVAWCCLRLNEPDLFAMVRHPHEIGAGK